ncbi:BnaA06g32080D [Brassica napus]|uniref:BnaA06g32080D protein n=2 Tax=Brassica TaxID=3705 RepID=A0A078FH15_BRANA|nr:BnaA06g32080D [Brassica napus]VDC68497.1 unnamed protein product [Brassica rapa]
MLKMNLPSTLFPSIDLAHIEDKYSDLSRKKTLLQIWVPTNPRGAERLPQDIDTPESDFYLHYVTIWLTCMHDLKTKQRYLVTFTVGYDQRKNIDAALTKFSDNFTIMLFHYDGRASEWGEFEWSKRTIHVSIRKQTKWWYAKRFIHPDIVAHYEFIFIWDEDLGVEHFDSEKYLAVVKKHETTLKSTSMRRRGMTGAVIGIYPLCSIMAPVFSAVHMIQNDLIHGWGLDFAVQKCVQNAHEKIGVVDAQWIIHQGVPSLGNQGRPEEGKQPCDLMLQGYTDQSYSYRLISIQLRYRVFVTIQN